MEAALSQTDEKWTPYRHPQPKNSPPELVVPERHPDG